MNDISIHRLCENMRYDVKPTAPIETCTMTSNRSPKCTPFTYAPLEARIRLSAHPNPSRGADPPIRTPTPQLMEALRCGSGYPHSPKPQSYTPGPKTTGARIHPSRGVVLGHRKLAFMLFFRLMNGPLASNHLIYLEPLFTMISMVHGVCVFLQF